MTSAADPSSYRDIYTVTIQAKSGSNNTWSYDSCIIYVYDKDALKIWVEGVSKDSATLSNIPTISAMSQDQILALQRDISLKTIVSANYGEFAWTDLSDRLTWSSEDPEIANLYYSQGGSYSGIDDYSYSSYRPATEFLLSGLNSGSTKITATHNLAGITDSLDVEITTLKNKLYLFACEPMTTTKLYYTNGNSEEKTATSNANGEFAIYDEYGIASDVYFESEYEGFKYYGTIKNALLESGEQDPEILNLYPQNNISLRKAAYATVYLKNSDGTPYVGDITIRGGVYINGEYITDAAFGFGSNATQADKKGNEDTTVRLGSDGKLSVLMDITQWGLEDNQLSQDDKVSYSFLVTKANSTEYYPLLINIDASENEDDYVRSGDNMATFRKNPTNGKHPFVIDANVTMVNDQYGYRETESILDNKGTIGISQQITEEDLAVSVMWWGVDAKQKDNYTMTYYVDNNAGLSTSSALSTAEYEYIDAVITTLSANINHEIASAAGIGVSKKNIELRYANNTKKVNCSEKLSFTIADATDKPFNADAAAGLASNINNVFNSSTMSSAGTLNMSDNLVSMVMRYFVDQDYKPDKDHPAGFSMMVLPTKDPLTFVAYLSTGLGNMTDRNVTGVYAASDEKLTVVPGMKEIKLAFGSGISNYTNAYKKELESVMNRQTQIEYYYNFNGYIESRLTLDPVSDLWEIHVMSGGFNAGGGVGFVKYINTWLGPVPITAELRGGGTVNVSLDTLTMEYLTSSNEVVTGTEFLTKLRIYFYFKFFGGIGWDYSIAALKIGLYGQINADMTYEWLNRPDIPDFALYPDETLIDDTSKVKDGQNLKIGGQIGIEFVAKLLFFSYEKAIFSYDFGGGFEKSGSSWNLINELWEKSQDYYNSLFHNIQMAPGGGRKDGETVMLDMSPTMLGGTEEGEWNSDSFIKPGLLGAVQNVDTTKMLSNANPYASPMLSDDGNILLYLTNSNGVIRTAYAVKGSNGYVNKGVISDLGYNTTGNVIAGNKDKAFAAWSSMGVDHNLEGGSLVSTEDQIIMMDSSEVYASVYNGSTWTTTQITSNDTADVSPVVAANNDRAIVTWRSVATSNLDGNITDFNENDTILYKVYSNGSWSSETYTLYNGTSGNVKAINAAMLPDGTSAVIFVIDTDSDDSTYLDREIFWAVIDENANVKRVVRATNDDKTDENPQITATKINNKDCFVIAWYSSDETATSEQTYYNICMADFGADGIVMDRLPQSLEKMITEKDLNITSDFRFTKGSNSVEDLALVWVERTEKSNMQEGYTVEYDILNSLKFYTFGDGNRVALTGVQKLADAPDSTLINNFDVVCTNNDATSVFLGTEYSPNETMTKTGVTLDGTTVEYEVPKSVSNIYSAKGEYVDQISVSNISYDKSSFNAGLYMPISFTVVNEGINPITSVAVEFDGKLLATKEGINLLPGESITLNGSHYAGKVRIKGTPYEVTAKTKNGDVTASGSINLSHIEVIITKANVVSEEKGIRTIQVKLNNDSNAQLKDSGKTVQLSFYSDPTYQQPIRKGISAVTISDNETLGLIDEGAFIGQVDFNPTQFLEKQSYNTGTIDAIPEEGIPVYIKVDVVDGVGQIDDNALLGNTASVLCENLEKRTGEQVSISNSLQATNQGSVVTASIKNNQMTPITNGQVTVTLYDENGKALESKSGGVKVNEVLTLAAEETKQITYNFNKQGAYAEVTFSNDYQPSNPGSYSGGGSSGGSSSNKETKETKEDKEIKEVEEVLFVDVPQDAYYYDAVRWAASNGIALGIGESHFGPLDYTNRAQMITFLWRAAGLPEPVSTENPFMDVTEDAYYYKAVLWAVENGITNGTSYITFSPDDNVSRGQAVTFLARMNGTDDAAEYNHSFIDVSEEAYYNNAVAWAYENEIAKGVSLIEFSPDDICVRGQTVTFLYRYFEGMETEE
ncbi:MAG: S-layer homology domain-containing protein [Bacillota bacterium]|nr:S-layer homology domain-containing protein [Bacillota bacterium]